MKRIFFYGIFSIFLMGLKAGAEENFFPKMKGCFLLYNLKTQSFEKIINEQNCRERSVACSTFKVPLAVMAFDSGILKDENVVFKWDGKKDARPEVNHDHNAKTWMRDSVVWFSQRLTPRLGKEKLQKYLHDFKYGNEDLSGGITMAWLLMPESGKTPLMISPYEQVEFLKKLWTDRLPASNRAMKLARDLTYLETSPKGFRLNGKTGSNLYHGDQHRVLGWFIAHIEGSGKEYISVANFSDLEPYEGQGYGGMRAKEITKKILATAGLW